MTSSNGNIFRVTGHWCGEFTGPRWIPAQRPVTWSFDVFFDLRPNKRLSKQSWGWLFETLSRPLWRHCHIIRFLFVVQPIVSLFISNFNTYYVYLYFIGGNLRSLWALRTITVYEGPIFFFTLMFPSQCLLGHCRTVWQNLFLDNISVHRQHGVAHILCLIWMCLPR